MASGAHGRDRGKDRPADFGLPVAAVASRVGVAASTLRAWERRYGVGPSARSLGGHRRYTNADVALLQRVHRLVGSGLPTAAAAARALTTAPADYVRPTPDRRAFPADLAQQFSAAGEALDARRLVRVASLALTRLGTVAAWNTVFVPRLHALGERWAASGAAIEREHVTVAVLQAALSRHAARHPPARSSPVVLAAATQAEAHTLPLDALAAALAEQGVATCLVGSVPPSALRAATSDVRPTVVVLWSRSAATADNATLRKTLQRAPATCAAGPGWKSDCLPTGVTHVDDLPGAVQCVLDLTMASGAPDGCQP